MPCWMDTFDCKESGAGGPCSLSGKQDGETEVSSRTDAALIPRAGQKKDIPAGHQGPETGYVA